MKEQQRCVQDIIVRGLTTLYCTDGLLHVTLMRLSEDLRYYNQSSYINFQAFSQRNLDVLCKSVPVGGSAPPPV